MSLNYIMKECPEFFKDEIIRQRVEQIIETANQNCSKISIKIGLNISSKNVSIS